MVKVMKQVRRGAVIVGAVMALTGLASSANAQNRSKRPRKVIRIAETKIEGRIQKPQAFYILQRSNLNFEGLALKNSFIPKIVESVDKAPF